MTKYEKIMNVVDNLTEVVNDKLALLTHGMSAADANDLLDVAGHAITMATVGMLTESDIAKISSKLDESRTLDENIIAFIKKIDSLVRESESLDETPNPAKPKCFGFAAIAETVTAEIAATAAKRDEDRQFVRAIVNDVAGDYGLTVISWDGRYDEDIRMGLDAIVFRNITQFIMRDIEAIINPRLDESETLREFFDLLNKAYAAATWAGVNSHDSRWTEYLEDFCPDAMKRIEDSDCQFKAECKRSLTFIALRLELDALRKVFNIPDPAADDDDLY